MLDAGGSQKTRGTPSRRISEIHAAIIGLTILRVSDAVIADGLDVSPIAIDQARASAQRAGRVRMPPLALITRQVRGRHRAKYERYFRMAFRHYFGGRGKGAT